ncbi:MAG TPA: hypothetical protein VNG90_02090 [Candidatus Acidoferrum sp.]|nr:hypothetical protein [Candidatus Acidoferrum sp.]
MKLLRTFIVYIVSFLCAFMVSTTIWLAALQATVLNVTVVKNWLASSGVYSKITDIIVPQASGPSSGLFSSEVTKQALAGTFPPAFVQQQAEQVLDDVYSWIDGKTANVSFSIPIDQRKAVAIQQLAAALGPEIAALPKCSASSPPQTDNVTCIPAGTDATSLTNDLANRSVNDSQLLNQPLTGTLFSSSSAGQKPNQTLAALNQLPTYRQWVDRLVLWLPIACIVCLIVIFFTAADRLGAFARLARRIFVGSLLTLIISLVMYYVGTYVQLSSSLPKSDASAVFVPVLQQILQGLGQELALLSGIVSLLSLAAWITLHRLRRSRHEHELLKSPVESGEENTKPAEVIEPDDKKKRQD